MATATSIFPSSFSVDVEDEEPIVLSELVRTAEASRLRRRGAMMSSRHRSVRQGSSSSTYVPSESWLGSSGDYPWSRPPPAQNIVPSPWTNATRSGRGTPLPVIPPPPPDYPSRATAWVESPVEFTRANVTSKTEDEGDSKHGEGFALYCGHEEWTTGDEEPYEPSPLPWLSSSRAGSSAAQRRKYRKSTGCGALIHTNGAPRTKSGTWHAKGKACAVVVPLDKTYFQHGGQYKQSACGCRWQGIGCSECGNPLGNVYIPCQSATATSPSQLARDQSRTQRRSSACTPPNPSAGYVYTFFADAVTSAPGFSFPSETSAVSLATIMHQTQTRVGSVRATTPVIPPASLGSFGRSSDDVSSPDEYSGQPWDAVTPLATGEESEYTYGYSEQVLEQEQEPGTEYDPDGVLISAEPGSPDKPSSEIMLWPAR